MFSLKMLVWLWLHINYVWGWQLQIAVSVCWTLLEEYVGWSKASSCTTCTARWGQLMWHQAGSSNCCWIEHSKVWHLCVAAAVTRSREASTEGCIFLSSRDGISVLQWWDVHASVFQQGRHPQSCQGREIAERSWSQYSWQAPVTAVWSTQVSEHQITSLSWKEASLGILCMQLDCNLCYMETVLTTQSKVLRVWSSLRAVFNVEMGWQCGVSKIFMFWQLGNKRTFFLGGWQGGEGSDDQRHVLLHGQWP